MDYICHYGPALRLATAALAGPGEHRVLGHFLPGILTAVCSLSCDECDECDECAALRCWPRTAGAAAGVRGGHCPASSESGSGHSRPHSLPVQHTPYTAHQYSTPPHPSPRNSLIWRI